MCLYYERTPDNKFAWLIDHEMESRIRSLAGNNLYLRAVLLEECYKQGNWVHKETFQGHTFYVAAIGDNIEEALRVFDDIRHRIEERIYMERRAKIKLV